MPKSKSRSKKQKSQSTLSKLTALHPIIVISIASILLLVISANVKTTQFLAVNSTQSVLGDDEDSSGNKEEDKSGEDKSNEDQEENKEEEKRNEEMKKVEEKTKEQEKKKQEFQSSKSKSVSPKPSKSTITPVSSDDDADEDLLDEESIESEQETEIETADGQKIKTKVKNGITTKIEIERGELKLKYEYKNGQLELKVENEDGEEVELDENELSELEDETETELEDEGLEVEALDEDTVAFTKNKTSAITNFPLSVDIGTNLLILSTPEGQRIVTILPDQAIQNLLKTGIVNTIDASADTQILDQLASGNEIVKLELKNKDIVYRIKGSKEHKILGFIPVNSPTTAFVSANSGNVVAQERSVLTSFVDLISP